MVTITLPSELEKAVTEAATQRGTTAELLTLDVLQEHFLQASAAKPSAGDRTLADALSGYIGAIDTKTKYPEGSPLSQNTGRRFARLMAEKRKQGKL